MTISDIAIFRRHAAARLILRCLGEQRDALERLAAECEGDLAEGLRDIARAVTEAIVAANIETVIDREVQDTDYDLADREEEERDRRILGSAQKSGR